MPSQAEHEDRARQASQLALTLSEDAGLLEWAVVAIFYRALHLIEARFAAESTHHTSHRLRNLRVNATLPALAPPYLRLYDFSLRARYGPPGEIVPADLDEARAHLAAIEGYLARP